SIFKLYKVIIILADEMKTEKLCSQHDVIEYLNMTTSNPQLTNSHPSRNWKEPLVVKLDITVSSLINIDMKAELITALLWVRMTWKNDFLNWDPDNFCGISRVPVILSSLWIPDLFIYEITLKSDAPTNPYLYIFNNGTVFWGQPIRVVSTCIFNLYKFPFDIQTCSWTFSPYFLTTEDLIIEPMFNTSVVTETSIENVQSNAEWNLVGLEVRKQNLTLSYGTWAQVVFEVKVERIPILYVVNLIAPVILLVVVDISSMFIPIEGGERLGFKITIILGFSVLLLVLNDMLPHTSSIPILETGVFCMACMAIMIVSVVESIVISYLMYLSAIQSNVPKWLKIWVLERLASFLYFNITTPQMDQNLTVDSESKNAPWSGQVSVPLFHKVHLQENHLKSTETFLLRQLLSEVLLIRRRLELFQREEDIKSEWKSVAFVLDRLFFILYLIAVLIILITVLTVWMT
uniref:5-hydroxytryptamine receptor 3A n=1 Tax=Latimeria chalumnae TaxID=7897 RepID=H2ZUJ4_LATCH